MHDLKLLSPLDFELLARDLIQAEFGVFLESFGPGRDSGIDFRFAEGSGATIVQVKHYLESGYRKLVAAAKKELPKVKKLGPSRYILVTSLPLSPNQKVELVQAMPGAPLQMTDILSREDIDNLLGRHPKVLRQHLKLWLANTETLERIVRAGIYNRTDAELEVVKGRISRYVQNKSIAEAENILEKRGSLIISGHPGVGKTTLMRMLMCLHLEQGWQVFVVEDMKEAMEVFTAGEKRLVVFDDFLGQVSLSTDTVRDVDRSLHRFLDRAQQQKDLRFILTTRDYLLSQAQQQSDRLNSSAVNAAELVLNVGAYTRSIRSQIVFNHIYFSDLTTTEKMGLLDEGYYLKVIDHRNFSPRIIDFITSASYLALQSESVRDVASRVLANPAILWKTPYEEHLSVDSQRVLQALFFSTIGRTVDDLEASFGRICAGFSLKVEEVIEPLRFRRAIKPLEGSMIAISRRRAEFNNPGIKDFLKQVILADNLFWRLLGCLSKFSELDSAWSFYYSLREQLGTDASRAAEWLEALRRAQCFDEVAPIRIVEIALQVASGFDHGDDGLLQFVADMMPVLRSTIPEPYDEMYFRHTLEHRGLMEEARRERIPELDTIAEVAAELLERHGPALELREIKSVADTIDNFGDRPDLGLASGKAAFTAWLAETFEDAVQVDSLEELETLDTELHELAKTFGCINAEHWAILALKRQKYEDEDTQASDDYSSNQWKRSELDFTDAEVQSLFSTILE